MTQTFNNTITPTILERIKILEIAASLSGQDFGGNNIFPPIKSKYITLLKLITNNNPNLNKES